MNVMNCKGCGRLFNAISNERICPSCKNALEEKFQEVKKYLSEHPAANMEEISTENDVSIKQIKQWVREERLIFSEGSLDGIECENCGTLIRTGRFCDKCKSSIANNLMSAIDRPKTVEKKKPTHDKDRMRFLQN